MTEKGKTMGKNTINSLAIRMAEVEDKIDELFARAEDTEARVVGLEQSSGDTRDLAWIKFVEPQDFVCLGDDGFVCEVTGCDDGSATIDGNGTEAHWERINFNINDDTNIPEYICSKCMNELIQEHANYDE